MRAHSCTTCLWEYMCDWDRSDCRYRSEKESDDMSKLEARIEAYIKAYQKLPHGHEVEGTVELLEECKNAIRMCTAHRWIPVEERLPKGKTSVICQFDNGDIELLWQDWERNRDTLIYFDHFADFDTMVDKTVIAWMPLPDPYHPEKESDENGTQSE